MLKITNLNAGYGGPPVLKDIHMEINEKEIVTIIGPNGAGKSTVLRSIFGITKMEKGTSIKYFSEELVGKRPEWIVRRGICYVPQGRTVFPSLTVEENLDMGAFIRKDKLKIADQMKYVYKKFPRLKERRHQKAKTMSGGEQQMLAIGRALMLSPELLLLDEPSLGLAPKIISDVFQKLLEIRDSGTSILMVEQNANQALAISDRGYVLELGENKYEGTGKSLLKDPKVGELYLGK
ncbi:MAG: ABC transporter ATP-binding protein [Candidatus Peregrinibacteria bacterium]|nr:ABC transporter ATP-binding protein [Candidatus Peregrinibacteria bacterium]